MVAGDHAAPQLVAQTARRSIADLQLADPGELRSFGIASMISWRGYWYIVHLGSVSGGGGTVDDPEPGKGTPAPSSTC